MDLTCVGLERTQYIHRLDCTAKIRARLFEDRPSSFLSRDKVSGSLKIGWAVDKKIELNGRYQFELTISRDEAAALFVAAYKDLSLDECLEALRRARRNKEQERIEEQAP